MNKQDERLDSQAGRLAEEALHELGDVPLDESISLYAKGDALKRQCEERLKAAQARIEKISLGSDGAPKGTEPFTAS